MNMFLTTDRFCIRPIELIKIDFVKGGRGLTKNLVYKLKWASGRHSISGTRMVYGLMDLGSSIRERKHWKIIQRGENI